jgi:hypothetical protein
MSTPEVFRSESFRTVHAESFAELHTHRANVTEFVRLFNILWKQANSKPGAD